MSIISWHFLVLVNVRSVRRSPLVMDDWIFANKHEPVLTDLDEVA